MGHLPASLCCALHCTWYHRESPNLSKVTPYNDMHNEFFYKISIMWERERERERDREQRITQYLSKVTSYNDKHNKFSPKIGIMRERDRDRERERDRQTETDRQTDRETWIVFPFMAVTTSPGLTAEPLGIFSHSGINAAKKDNKCTLNEVMYAVKSKQKQQK